MHIEQLRSFVLSLEDVEECCPFGPDVLVYKTNGKVFLLLPLDAIPVRFNVKCEPDKAIEQRDAFPETILPGYHMNKKHWNTILVDGSLNDDFLMARIVDSYHLIRRRKG
jgi:predicted DNA-binding protein (MmcQ/YjbR family)